LAIDSAEGRSRLGMKREYLLSDVGLESLVHFRFSDYSALGSQIQTA
jgi:hypothetical protein